MRFNEFSFKDDTTVKMFHSTVSSGHRAYVEHHHTECELSLIISGGGIYRIGKLEYDFTAGDIFLFASNEAHCITDINSFSPFDILNIHFEPRILWSQSGFGSYELLKIFHSRSDSFSNRIDRNNEKTAYIKNLIYQIEKEFINAEPAYELSIKMDIAHILICLIRNYGYVKHKESAGGYTEISRQLELALDYIDNNLDSPITLDSLSKISAMNKSYFSTSFKKYNGISPWEYITIKRVEKAISLIKSSDLNKLEIASICGFSSSSNFYKAFKRITGKSPGEYIPRKQL